MAPVPFGQWAIKIKPGCFLRPYKDNNHILVDTIKLIKDWCVSPLPMTIYILLNILKITPRATKHFSCV